MTNISFPEKQGQFVRHPVAPQYSEKVTITFDRLKKQLGAHLYINICFLHLKNKINQP